MKSVQAADAVRSPVFGGVLGALLGREVERSADMRCR